MADTRDPDHRLPEDRNLSRMLPEDRNLSRMPEERSSNAMIGWAAGAVFIVLVLLFVFGVGRDGSRTADTNAPSATTGQSTASPPAARPAAPPATSGQGTR